MQTNPNEIIRVHIWVKGRVQAVGFRAHVEYFALQIGVFVGHDDLHSGVGRASRAQEYIPILVDEVQVHQHQVGFDLFQQCVGLLEVPRLPDFVAPLLKIAGQGLGGVRIALG